MGSGFSTHCANCHAGEQFLLGVGMQYHSLLNVVSNIQGGARKKVLEIMERHNVQDGEFEHRLYACPECNTLHGRFYVHLKYDDGQVYEIPFRCGHCRTPLVPANEDELDRYTCKECGQHTLEHGSPVKMWD
ncbi:hypothetical protein FE236_00560 [Mariprofundus erugo]|uniref:hypothetical protein n=1 Tax=Mariprofundus erugo TaxID=2528639 RepID=UPI0010FE131D|nr:hypothetical protein [Mariprofundus erugo]TLS78286.1 hypothetical protein FE236_00560 [Mariprofundus erugo]